MSHDLLIEGVTKRYAAHVAVRDLTLAVPHGTIYGILGPNGAGKSTTLRMVMNIISRDEGRISLLGSDPAIDRTVLRRVGYLPEERGLYRKMRVLDAIAFFAQLKRMSAAEARRAGEAWLERMGLAEWRDARVETLSKGMQQKVQFITTVLHDPELLILDEPHSGLDPVNQEVLRETIVSASSTGRTVILSTHNMEQAEQLCTHVCIIAGGRKVLDGVVADVRREHGSDRYRIQFDRRSDEAVRFMSRNRLFTVTRARGSGWDIELSSGTDQRELLAQLNALDVCITRFERVEPSLHEIFVSRVGESGVAAREPDAARV